jgi:hypothetical protein
MSLIRSWTAVTSSWLIIRPGAVADHHEHVAVRGREPDAQAAGDLVAHRRVAVLDVVALRVARPPQLVEVARHRARGADDDVPRGARGVDRADDLGLGRQRGVAQGVGPLDGRVPVAGQAGRLGAVAVVDSPALERAAECLERRPRVGDERRRPPASPRRPRRR